MTFVMRVKANSMLCVWCNKWVYNKCSRVKGMSKKVEGVFHCRVCVQGRVVEDVVESKKNGVERVECFGYLGDKLNTGVGYLRAVTSRVHIGWKKFKGLSGTLCGKKLSMKLKGKVNNYKSYMRMVIVM